MRKTEDYINSLNPTFGEKVKTKVKNAGSKVVELCRDHGTEVVSVITVSTVAVKGARSIINSFRPTKYEKERKRIDHTFYDPSRGTHYDLKRKMTNKENLELSERKANGEDVGKILKSMKLLK